MRAKLDIQGLTPEEHKVLSVIAQTANRVEVSVLRLAGLMGEEGETSGALWLVRRVIARRMRMSP